MTEDQENALRNALDAVDRGRRWAMLGMGALVVAAVLALGTLVATAAAHQDSSPSAGVFKVVFVASLAQMLLIACCTAIVMFHVTRMTKVVLRRIALLTRD
jgi:hypothetical protein